jgi:hypothetical protein
MKFKSIQSGLVAILIFLSGCLESSSGQSNNQQPNPNPDKEVQTLSVMLYSIDDKSDNLDTDISIQPKIRLKFSDAINLRYLNRAYIDVYSTEAGYIDDIKYSFVDNKHTIVELSFPKSLGSLQKYYINISKNIVSVNGVNLVKNMTYSFITTEVENKKVGFVINNSIDKNQVPLEQVQLKFQFVDEIIASGIRSGDIKLYKGDLDPNSAIDLDCKFDADNGDYKCPISKLDSNMTYYVILDNVLDSQKHPIFGRFIFHSTIAPINTKFFGVSSGNLNDLYNAVDKQGNIYVAGTTSSSSLYVAKFSSGLLKRWDIEYKPKTNIYVSSSSIFINSTQVLIIGFDENEAPCELLTIDKNNGAIKYEDNVNKLFGLKPDNKIKQLVFDKTGNAYALFTAGDGYPILSRFNIDSEVVKQWEKPLNLIDINQKSVKESIKLFIDNRVSVPTIYVSYYYETSDYHPPYAYSAKLGNDNNSSEPYMLFGLIIVNLSTGEMEDRKNKIQDYSALDFRLDSYYGYDRQMLYIYHNDSEQNVINTGKYKTASFRLARDDKYVAKSIIINDQQGAIWVGGYNYTDNSKKTSYAFLQKCDSISGGVASCSMTSVPSGTPKGLVKGQQISYGNDVVVLTGVSDFRFSASEQNLGSSSDGVGFITIVKAS